MRKQKELREPAETQKSKVDVGFIQSSSLPRDKAIHVAALMAGVTDRRARVQYERATKGDSE